MMALIPQFIIFDLFWSFSIFMEDSIFFIALTG